MKKPTNTIRHRKKDNLISFYITCISCSGSRVSQLCLVQYWSDRLGRGIDVLSMAWYLWRGIDMISLAWYLWRGIDVLSLAWYWGDCLWRGTGVSVFSVVLK